MLVLCGCGVGVVLVWCGCGVDVVLVWCWCGVGVVWPHHTKTTLFEKSCGVGVVWLWCWCGVGVVSVWFGRRLSVVCHRKIDLGCRR